MKIKKKFHAPQIIFMLINYIYHFFSLFVKIRKLNHQTLFDLILAANYLDNKHLLEGACKVVASDMLKKTDDEIRQMWGVTNDFVSTKKKKNKREKEFDFLQILKKKIKDSRGTSTLRRRKEMVC